MAGRASILFFCVADLAAVDPMYQYSLQWFINLFVVGIDKAERSDDIQIRLRNLNEFFTYSLYQNICRSLFEVHKLLFSFMLCLKIRQAQKLIEYEELRFLLTGGTSTVSDLRNPATGWWAIFPQFVFPIGTWSCR